MRLLYFANIRLPTEKAHGIQIMKMCEAFARAGVQVTLVIPTRKNKQFAGIDQFDYFGVQKCFTITQLKTFDPVFLIGLPGAPYIKLQGWLFGRAVAKYLSGEQLRREDLLFTRDEYMLRCFLRKHARVVWEAHTIPSHVRRYVNVWKRCDGIVAISNGLKNELTAWGIDAHTILVAPDGVDIEKFKVSAQGGSASGGQSSKFKMREILGLPLEKKIVMYTGHLYRWKGIETLLAAAQDDSFKASHAAVGEVVFVIVGGTQREVNLLKERVKHLKLSNVLIEGHRPPTEIPRWLAAADVFVLPNSGHQKISRSYTSPLKLFEYMAAGNPIVASDIPSIAEIIQNGANAILVAPDDPHALAGGIVRVLADESWGKQLAVQARCDVEKYDWHARAGRIMSALDSNEV